MITLLTLLSLATLLPVGCFVALIAIIAKVEGCQHFDVDWGLAPWTAAGRGQAMK
jgi:hypothetical protein